jgi:5-methylcytosine-specific restriction endonuclease McrA
VYNSKKIRGMCEFCNERMGKEIHHLNPQKDADDDGFIGSMHKNHKANLVSICEECHDRLHKEERESTSDTVRKIVKKKTTNGYKLLLVS